MVRVALRAAAHGLPLRQEPHQDAALVERLEDVDRAVALRQQQHELVDRAGRPALLPRRRIDLVGQPVQRGARQRDVALGGDPGRAQHDRRIGGRVGARRQLDGAVDDDEPVADALLVPELVPRHVPPGAFGDPADRAGGRRDVGHEVVGRARADGRGDGVLVLEPQHVAGAAGDAVERDADVDEPAVALVQQGEIVGWDEQVRVGGPPQRLDVAQPAVAVLEVGLEQERDVAGLGAPLDHLRAQRVEPAPAVAAPAGEPLGGQPGRQLLVAREVTGAQRGGRRVEVVAGEAELVVERAHGVAELQTGVPERVPERRRRLVDAPDLAVVEEEHVDVALRGELAAAVATDGDEGHRRTLPTRRDAGRGVAPQRTEHVVGRARQRSAQRPTSERRVGDQRVTGGGEGRSRVRRRHPCRVGHRRRSYRGEVNRAHPRRVRGTLPVRVLLAVGGALLLTSCTDDGATAPTVAPATTTTTTVPERVDDGVLRVGVLLPETGPGASLGTGLAQAVARGARRHQRRRRRARPARRDRRGVRRG